MCFALCLFPSEHFNLIFTCLAPVLATRRENEVRKFAVASKSSIPASFFIFVLDISLVGVRLVSKIQSYIAFPLLCLAVLAVIFGLIRWQVQGTNENFAGFSKSVIDGNLK
jgi:amino acid permease